MSVTKEAIKQGVEAVGVAAGDTVFVHSSLSAFGHVDGGADTVIDALLEVLGDTGTLVMPTFTWSRFHDADAAVFDVVNTPSETGRITEVFRHRDGVKRGIHLCHSVAAVGPNTEAVLGDGKSSFGRGSTFDALYELDSWNLFLGVDFRACTALHVAEELMNVPYRKHRSYDGSTVVLPDGSVIPSESTEFLRIKGYWNDFQKMGAIFNDAGIVRQTTVGEAELSNARIRQIIDISKHHLAEDIGFLLNPNTRHGL